MTNKWWYQCCGSFEHCFCILIFFSNFLSIRTDPIKFISIYSILFYSPWKILLTGYAKTSRYKAMKTEASESGSASKHIMCLCEVIENGLTPIYDVEVEVEGTTPRETTYKNKFKILVIKQWRKEKKKLALITLLKATSQARSTESTLSKSKILELPKKCGTRSNSLALDLKKWTRKEKKFDTFKMLLGEFVEAMKIRFTEIILGVTAINRNKYMHRKENLKVICAPFPIGTYMQLYILQHAIHWRTFQHSCWKRVLDYPYSWINTNFDQQEAWWQKGERYCI